LKKCFSPKTIFLTVKGKKINLKYDFDNRFSWFLEVFITFSTSVIVKFLIYFLFGFQIWKNCRFVSKVRQIKMLNPLATHHVSCSLDLCDSGLNLFRHLWNHWQLGSRHLAADNKTAHQNKENLTLIFNFFYCKMKFLFCGGQDCPDWLLAEMSTLSRLTSVKTRLIANQVVQALMRGNYCS
jgi:hypothetical protein